MTRRQPRQPLPHAIHLDVYVRGCCISSRLYPDHLRRVLLARTLLSRSRP